MSQELSGEEEMGVSGKDGEEPAACPTEETGGDARERPPAEESPSGGKNFSRS